MTSGDELMTTDEVSAVCRVPVGTLRQWRHYRKGPDSFRLNGRVVYRRSKVFAWIDAAEKATATN